jgi:hypothetical protein
MPQVASKDEIQNFPMADARLTSIEWFGNTGLRLTLTLPGAPERIARLICDFVTELHIKLEFRDLAGAPLTWDTTLAEIPGAGWHVLLDFAGAPLGAIEFDCAQLTLEYEGGP